MCDDDQRAGESRDRGPGIVSPARRADLQRAGRALACGGTDHAGHRRPTMDLTDQPSGMGRNRDRTASPHQIPGVNAWLTDTTWTTFVVPASSPESGSCRSAYAGGGAHWPRSSICPARAQPWRDLGARPTAAMPPTPAPRSVAVRIRPGSSGQTINTPDKRQTQGVAPGHPAPVGVVHSSGTRCDETGQQAPAIMAGASHRCRHRHRPLPDRHPGRCPTWSATRAGALLSHSAVVPVVTTPVAERVDLIRSAGPGRSRRRRPSETPLFEALTTEWTAFGRIVPDSGTANGSSW